MVCKEEEGKDDDNNSIIAGAAVGHSQRSAMIRRWFTEDHRLVGKITVRSTLNKTLH